MSKYYMTCWHDKVEDRYLPNLALDQSIRSMERGYLQYFDQNNQMKFIPALAGRSTMNIEEYELVVVGEFDDESGTISPVVPPRVLNPYEVLTKPRDTKGQVLPD